MADGYKKWGVLTAFYHGILPTSMVPTTIGDPLTAIDPTASWLHVPAPLVPASPVRTISGSAWAQWPMLALSVAQPARDLGQDFLISDSPIIGLATNH